MARRSLVAAASIVLGLTITSVAQAQLGSIARTFLSGGGNDVGTCPLTAPCRSLGYAITQQAPNGQMILLDTAGYGVVTITHAVSIISEGHISLVNVPSGNGITINAGPSDSIVLRGLTVDGLGTGSNGIVFNSGGSLTITNCLVQNFVGSSASAGSGIYLHPISTSPTITILNTTVSNNGYAGLYYYPQGTGTPKITVDHLAATTNGRGLVFDTSSFTGVTYGHILNSNALNNGTDGFLFLGSTTNLQAHILDSSFATGNFYGIHGNGQVVLDLSRSLSNYNAGGGLFLENSASACSYGDNRIAPAYSFSCVSTPK
jgi:hypothetical protein